MRRPHWTFAIIACSSYVIKQKDMKAKPVIIAVLLFSYLLVACAPETALATASVPINTSTPSQAFTPIPPTLAPTPITSWQLATPFILATPLNLSFSNSSEIVSIIDHLYPDICIRNGFNSLLAPTPIEPAAQAYPLAFTEVNELPTPSYPYEVFAERADNINKSRIAYANMVELYVKDNTTNKLYRIDVGAEPGSALRVDDVQWINADTVVVTESSHVWIVILAINVTKQKYEYYGLTPGCQIASTP